MKQKVTVVGAGNVGATAAQRIVEKELADVALIDIVPGVPQGKSLDIMESAPVEKFDARMSGSNDYEISEGSDVVVITAGVPRKPGMSRDDLVATNEGIVADVVRKVLPGSPDAILIIVSNPLDAMCEVARRVSKLPRERVFGMAGVLDSARMRWFIADALGCSVENTHAFVLGGHGDTMVPLPRFSTVAGIPIPELLPKEKIDAIVQRTRDGGAEIVNLLKTSAWYAPASAVVEMVDAVLRDKKKILPCAAYLQGEYGMRDVYLGVPVQLGREGHGEGRRDRADPRRGRGPREVRRRGPGALRHPEGLSRWRPRAAPACAASTRSRGSCRSARFLAFHLFVNAQAARGADAYNAMAAKLQALPLAVALEILVIALPIFFHGIYGLFVTATEAPGEGRPGRGRRALSVFQRATGVLLFAFVLFHLWTARLVQVRDHESLDLFRLMQAVLSSPWMRAVYVAGPDRGHGASFGRALHVRRRLGPGAPARRPRRRRGGRGARFCGPDGPRTHVARRLPALRPLPV